MDNVDGWIKNHSIRNQNSIRDQNSNSGREEEN